MLTLLTLANSPPPLGKIALLEQVKRSKGDADGKVDEQLTALQEEKEKLLLTIAEKVRYTHNTLILHAQCTHFTLTLHAQCTHKSLAKYSQLHKLLTRLQIMDYLTTACCDMSFSLLYSYTTLHGFKSTLGILRTLVYSLACHDN